MVGYESQYFIIYRAEAAGIPYLRPDDDTSAFRTHQQAEQP